MSARRSDAVHPRALHLSVLLTVAAAALAYVAHLVARHTIAVVEARRLLPRWDLATHLGSGWLDYHLLVTGRIPRLLWDVWLQGYWPPVLSIYQIPFYLVLGGGMASGLRAALATFALIGLTACVLLWRLWGSASALPAALFLTLLMSSPFLLAYASVTMTEMPGALMQLLVLLSYLHYRRDPTPRAARRFALSLTLLFFTKYNYFLLLVVPLVLYECLERTEGLTGLQRVTGLWGWTLRFLSSPTGAFIVLYCGALLVIVATGGFDFQFFGNRVSVHTIGNTGHVVLYVLLARLWYQQRRGRIDWTRLTSLDPRVRPILLWFAVPVIVWFASPYPNHIRDFFNLVFNRPLGEPTVAAGTAAYLDVLGTSYFFSEWLLALTVVVFATAAVQYRRQSPLMRWLVIAIPLQFTAIVMHPTRLPRFLVPTAVLLCLAASSEVGRWVSRSRGARVASNVLAPVVLGLGVLAARDVVAQPRFRAVAFENYTDDAALRGALDSIRAELSAADRLAIVGEGNELSPALLRWELGPPSGLPCFPFEIGGARGIDLGLATRVLLMTPVSPDSATLDLTNYYFTQRRAVLAKVDRGELVLRREIMLPGMHVAFQLYDRTATTDRVAACQ